MGTIVSKFRIKKATMSARVYRAQTDTWEELGVISSTSGLEMLKIKIQNFFKKYF